jgi:alpha-tubulin suppressor-like RCC1 family protein
MAERWAVISAIVEFDSAAVGDGIIGTIKRATARSVPILIMTVPACAQPSVTAMNNDEPHSETMPLQFSAISAGAGHTCALIDTGHAYCWGSNRFGMLGGGTGEDLEPHPMPEPVLTTLSFKQISAGWDHNCGVTVDERGLCWGSGRVLGGGTTEDRFSPTLIDYHSALVVISAGAESSCAITGTGAAVCWGDNPFGVLGDTTRSTASTDVALEPVQISSNEPFVDITVGQHHACAIPATLLHVYCWGRPTLTGHTNPVLVGAFSYIGPSEIDGDYRFVSLEAAGTHTCGLVRSGDAYCWGWNARGELGNGDRGSVVHSPGPVMGSLRFSSIAVGGSHTCAVAGGGNAFCWGDNSTGQLGNGVVSDSVTTSPESVAGGHHFATISVGGGHTCGLTGEGLLLCWGANDAGQLGDGTITDRAIPVPVAGQS